MFSSGVVPSSIMVLIMSDVITSCVTGCDVIGCCVGGCGVSSCGVEASDMLFVCDTLSTGEGVVTLGASTIRDVCAEIGDYKRRLACNSKCIYI